MELSAITDFFSDVTLLVLYTGLLFAGWAWMLKAENKGLEAKIENIKELLANHITDTNKKIDDLRQDTNKKFDDLRQEIKEIKKMIYELLVKEKETKP